MNNPFICYNTIHPLNIFLSELEPTASNSTIDTNEVNPKLAPYCDIKTKDSCTQNVILSGIDVLRSHLNSYKLGCTM